MGASQFTAARRAAMVILATCSLPAYATNGFNLIGFGAESTLMGGADVAVARDPSALNTNPAGLAQIQGRMFNGFASLLRTTDLRHEDQWGNDEHASNRYTGLGGGGYAQSLESLPCTAGVGMFAQGGAGGVFKNITTPAGNEDKFSALFGIAKLTGGLGCQVTDDLALGGSFGLVYASLEQNLYGNTATGAKIEDVSTIRPTFKLGLQYKLTPRIVLAASYTGKTELPMTDGEMKVNTGSGYITYHDVSFKGFALPREIAVGAAFRPNDDWLLSVKLNWLEWSDALTTSTLRATNPDNAAAPDVMQTNTLNWKNQWVIATGAAYTLNDRTTLYAGYNYGRNPIPRNNSTPFIAGILEHHYTMGAAYKWNEEWTVTGGIEYDARIRVKYNNPDLPYFGNSAISNEAIFLHFMLTRQW